jgi:hypothetical protein
MYTPLALSEPYNPFQLLSSNRPNPPTEIFPSPLSANLLPLESWSITTPTTTFSNPSTLFVPLTLTPISLPPDNPSHTTRSPSPTHPTPHSHSSRKLPKQPLKLSRFHPFFRSTTVPYSPPLPYVTSPSPPTPSPPLSHDICTSPPLLLKRRWEC